MPDDYYVSQYSGEEIDAAVGRAATGGALDKRIATFVNPNLLDNWYFAYPVNQRNVSGPIDAVGYFLDRWKLVSGSVTIGSNGITLNGTIVQILETAVGTDVTASALATEGVVVASYDNNSKTFSLTGTGQTFVAAKLELGSQQTLAHQDADGNWVMNEIPDFGEQLARCQRYFLKIGDASRYCSLGTGVARDEQFVSLTIPTPITMRTVPGLVAVPVGFTARHSDTKLSGGVIFFVDAASQNSIMLKVQAQVSLTAGEAWEAFLEPNGSIMLSADL